MESRTETSLKGANKIIRQRFVLEYVKDFNATKAIQRLGVNGSIGTQRKRASEFLREPYVQQLIDEYLRNAKEDSIVTRQRVLAGLLHEAETAGEGGTRVTAWCNLGKMLGMYVEKKELKLSGCGVMILPASANPAEWEAAATAAQQTLKEDVTRNG